MYKFFRILKNYTDAHLIHHLMIKIGITFSKSNYANYPLWVKGNESSIGIIELSYETNNLENIYQCDSIVFAGGIDMDPLENIEYAHAPKKINLARDQFELAVLEKVLQEQKFIISFDCTTGIQRS